MRLRRGLEELYAGEQAKRNYGKYYTCRKCSEGLLKAGKNLSGTGKGYYGESRTNGVSEFAEGYSTG